MFGDDLDVTLVESEHRETDEARVLSYESGALVEHFVRRHALRYDIENRGGSEREVALALSFVNDTKVEGADAVFFDAPSRRAFASFSVKAKARPRAPSRRMKGSSDGTSSRP